MTTWIQRPIEVANLLNPAFCSIVLHEAVKGYVKSSDRAMPYPLIFLVLPIVLPEATRQALPIKVITKLHSWLNNNPWVKIRFAQQTQKLIPYTKEAIIFGLQREIIMLDSQGEFNYLKRKLSTPDWPNNSEPIQILKKAAFVGRWFAESGDPTIIYPLWGIKP